MRPLHFKESTQIRSLGLIVAISLLLGVIITVLLWLNVAAQIVSLLFWFSLGVAGLGALLFLRPGSAYSRGLRLLAVLAAVSLVYLFPEMFRPSCGGVPRVFALDNCQVCTRHENYWDFYGNQKSRCVEWVDICVDPVIEATLECTQWGNSDWCKGGLSVNLVATEAQGHDILVSGDVDGTTFACPSGAGSVNCSVPLPEGTGTINYNVTSTLGRSASGSLTYWHDSLQPQIDGWLDGTPGNAPWFISSVDVNASALDLEPGSGLAAFEYNLDGAGWSNFPGTLNVSDGVHSLSLRSTDVAGNVVETSQTIQVDTVTPALNLSIVGTAGAHGWYISTVELHADVTDDGSGPAVLEARADGGEWEAYTAPLAFNDGGHSFQFRALDYAGNLIETPLQGLSVDTTPPVIDLPASWTLGQAIRFKLQDDGSGLAGLRLVIEDEDEAYPKVTWDDNLSGNKFQDEIAWDGRFKDGSQAAPGGEYYAWLKVTDNAGNESMQAGQIIVEESTSPLITIADKTIPATEAPVSVEPKSESPDPALSLPINISPVTSFGGGNNGLQPSTAQTKKESFAAGSTTTSQSPDFQSNVLWGASATAAIGAFAAEVARRQREAAEARAAERAASVEANQKHKNIVTAYRASLKNFENEVNKARAFGMTDAEAAELKANIAKSGKIGTSLGAAQEYVANKVAENQALREAERSVRKEELLNPEIPIAKLAYVPKDVSWKQNDIAQLEHAYEVAAKINWWENTKSFVKNQIVQPVNEHFYQPYVKPALEEAGKTIVESASWVNENVYQPHIKPMLNDAKQTMTNVISWTNEKVYQPYVQPAVEKAAQDVATGIKWANEKIYQPYVQPSVEKVIQSVSEGISWANENIYQPYVQPALEKEIQAIATGIAWVNEKIYQPYIQPALEEAGQAITAGIEWADENIYQPYIQPALEEAGQAITAGIEWANEKIYEPIIKPVLDDVVQGIVEGVSWVNEKIYQPYVQPALASINENVFQPYVNPLVANLVGNIKDGLGNNASLFNEFIYQPFIQPIVADINQYIYQPYFKPLQDQASSWWNETWGKYGEWVHGALDTVGFIPGLGDIADGINGLIYLGEGRYLEAAISVAAMIPLVGDLGKGGKWSVKLGKEVVETAIEETAEKVVKEVGQEVLENAAEKAAKEIGSEMLKDVTEEIVEETVEVALREGGQEVVEKTIKVTTEEIAEKSIRELGKETVEKTTKIVSENAVKLPTSTLSSIIEKNTTRKLSEEIAQNTAKVVTEETVQRVIGHTTGEIIATVKKFGAPAIKVLDVVDLKAANKLLKNLDADIIDYIIEQGPEAIAALSHWPEDFLKKHGAELALRAKQDARALEAATKLVDLIKNMDVHDAKELVSIMKTQGAINTLDNGVIREAKELLDTIAYNSIQNSGDRIILGKWVPGTLDEGFIGAARSKGALFYGTNPGLEKIFSCSENIGAGDLFWSVNNRVLEIANEQNLIVDYSLSGLSDQTNEIKAIMALQSGVEKDVVAREFFRGEFPFRMKEAQALIDHGYIVKDDAIDLINKIIHWSKS